MKRYYRDKEIKNDHLKLRKYNYRSKFLNKRFMNFKMKLLMIDQN